MPHLISCNIARMSRLNGLALMVALAVPVSLLAHAPSVIAQRKGGDGQGGGIYMAVCMLMHMRTTINLPDGLGEEAKRQAAERGCTFTALVVEGLHLVLHGSAESESLAEMPRYGGAGGRLLVDLADKAAVAEALDADGLR